MNQQKGVCCQYCIKFEKSACPIKEASPWSRWGDWCSKYEPNPDEKEAVTLEEASSGRAKPETTALPGKYGEPWRTMAPPNGGVLLKMGPGDTNEAVQIFPREKGERIKECVNACAGMDDPAREIADLVRAAKAAIEMYCEMGGMEEVKDLVKVLRCSEGTVRKLLGIGGRSYESQAVLPWTENEPSA